MKLFLPKKEENHSKKYVYFFTNQIITVEDLRETILTLFETMFMALGELNFLEEFVCYNQKNLSD